MNVGIKGVAVLFLCVIRHTRDRVHLPHLTEHFRTSHAESHSSIKQTTITSIAPNPVAAVAETQRS